MATKKRDLKLLKQLAEQMPVIKAVKTYKTEVISGKEVVERMADGKVRLNAGDDAVDTRKQYKVKHPVMGDLNHVKNMKKLHKQHGAAGVMSYVQAVKNHTQK